MAQSSPDLSRLFGAALDALRQNRQQINDLDGYNGNHGDNMVHNLGVITQALQGQAAKPPAEALSQAASRLQAEGHGGTSQYYAQGLSQAADKFRGRDALSDGDVLSLVQSLLGAVPAQGGAPAAPAAPGGAVLGQILGQATGAGGGAGGSVLEALLGGAGGASAPAEQGGGDLLGGLLGALGGGQGAPAQPQNDGLGLDDLANAAGRFMQAKQAGSDNVNAAAQAALGLLAGGSPLQSNSPRAAAGGLIAQTVLQALLGRK